MKTRNIFSFLIMVFCVLAPFHAELVYDGFDHETSTPRWREEGEEDTSGGNGDDNDSRCGGCGGKSCSCNEKAAEAMEEVEEIAETLDLYLTMDDAIVEDRLLKEYLRAQADAAPAAGDPVRITTGEYVLDETELLFTRHYTGDRRGAGTLGNGWAWEGDQRLIRGIDPDTSQIRANLQNSIKRLEEISVKMNGYQYKSAAAKENYPIVLKIIADTRTECDSLTREAERSAALAALNVRTLFSGMDSSCVYTGNETITWIDERGTARHFSPKGDGVWVPDDAGLARHTRLESVDGGDAASASGFILTGKNGKKTQFNRWGQLVSVLEIPGSRTVFNRDPDSGTLRSVTGPDGRSYRFEYGNGYLRKILASDGTSVGYSYADSALSDVTDVDGDTIRYRYTDGNITAIEKPDGSVVSIRHEGNRIVSTVNEEGHAERFAYDEINGTTLYSSASGVSILYAYDRAHRVIRESRGDGTEIVNGWNTSTGDLVSETRNGNTTVFTYDSRGNRNAARYSDGSAETWTWNEADQLTAHTDRDRVLTEWFYDEAGNCTEARRNGESVYRARFRALSPYPLETAEGQRPAILWTYDSSGNPLSRSVRNGSDTITENWTHDARGRTLTYTDGEGREWTHEYEGRTATVRFPSGLIRRSTTNARKDTVSIEEIDSVTGDERCWAIVHDRRHLPVSETGPDGFTTLYEWNADGKIASITQDKWKTSFSYDEGGNLSERTRSMQGSNESIIEKIETVISPDGTHRTFRSFSADGSEARTVVAFDSWGRPVSVTDPSGDTVRRDISPGGRVTREQNRFGGWTGFGYDPAGRNTASHREGFAESETSWNPDGSVRSERSADGALTAYEYDERGLRISATSPESKKTWTYDRAGRLVRFGTTESWTDMAYSDDERSVVIREGGLYTETRHLNAWGEIVGVIDGEGNAQTYTRDGAGRIATASDGYGNITRYTYNALGEIASVTLPDGSTSAYEYTIHGSLARVTDGCGLVWSGSYDSDGRLIAERGRPGFTREYRYDQSGRLIETSGSSTGNESREYADRGTTETVRDGDGRAYIYRRDSFGRLTEERNREGDTQEYQYDQMDRAVSVRSFSGKLTLSSRDESSRTSTRTYPDGTFAATSWNESGQIIEAAGETGSIRWTYDAGGRMTAQHDVRSGETTRYGYDRAGRRTVMISGDRYVLYSYGKNGELSGIEDTSKGMSASFVYDRCGRETARTFGNGVTVSREYDLAGRVIAITERSAGGSILRSESYTYDEDGRRALTTDEKGAVTQYRYDESGRIAAVIYPWSEERAAADRLEAMEAGLSLPLTAGKPVIVNINGTQRLSWPVRYTYDANGNRLGKTTPWGTISWSYDHENRIVSSGATTYTWDSDGNLLEKKGLQKTASYTYTCDNRMKTAVMTDLAEKTRNVSQYQYDALGRRTLTAREGAVTLRTLYDGTGFDVIREDSVFADGSFISNLSAGHLATSTSSSRTRAASSGDTAVSRYRWLDGNESSKTGGSNAAISTTRGMRTPLYALDTPVAESQNLEGVRYFGTDITGSLRSLTTADSRVPTRFEYDIFGVPTTDASDITMSYGYASKPHDPITGLCDYGYRDYDPSSARFTSVDPIRDSGNWYAYTGNDPVNYVDLWGLSASEVSSDYTVPDNFYAQFNAQSMQEYWAEGTPSKVLGTTSCSDFLPAMTKKLGGKVFSDIFTHGENQNARELLTTFSSNRNLTELSPNGTNVERANSAQEYANDGHLVISALETTGTGHVSAVGPTTLKYDSYPTKAWAGHSGSGPRQTGDGTGNQPLRDYPVFVQAGAYTGVVDPGYAQGRTNLNENKIHYFVYTPKD